MGVPYFTKVWYESGVSNFLSNVIVIVSRLQSIYIVFSLDQLIWIYLNCFLLKPCFFLSNVTLFIDQQMSFLFRYLKLWQNKKDRIFVWDHGMPTKNDVFFSAASCKKSTIFGASQTNVQPWYFVAALVHIKETTYACQKNKQFSTAKMKIFCSKV